VTRALPGDDLEIEPPMPLTVRDFQAAGYRSLRSIRIPLGGLSVFVGANGVGKTNLYRALQLLQASAAGTLSQELAGEGGMQSALWAGKRTPNQPVQLTLSADFGEADGPAAYRYSLAVGLPPSFTDEEGNMFTRAGAFVLEAQVKEESLVFNAKRRPEKLLERRGAYLAARDEAGLRQEIATELMASETALGSLSDPSRFPDLHTIRRTMLDWCFYHDLRSDQSSPLRRPCLAVTSPTLASDGSNLAAVFATLVHLREDTADLNRAIEEAFPGARLVVPNPGRTASFGMIFPDYPKRVFDSTELSDGTLRYLALAGVLLAYRLPAFVALNEPETSLHPDLLDPLARLIVRASERTQIWLVTHSERLADALAKYGKIKPRIVIKRQGETWIEGLTMGGDYREDDDT
jgi:predicted ATPase